MNPDAEDSVWATRPTVCLSVPAFAVIVSEFIMNAIVLCTSRMMFLCGLLVWSPVVMAQNGATDPQSAAKVTESSPAPVVFTTQQDHQEMLQQLGITKLRPGRNSNANAPNASGGPDAILSVWVYESKRGVASSNQSRSSTQKSSTDGGAHCEGLRNKGYGDVESGGRIETPLANPDAEYSVWATRHGTSSGQCLVRLDILQQFDNSD